MEPGEFMEYWKISRSELALLLGKSLNTVNQWFSKGERSSDPPADVLRRLDEFHLRFLEWELQDKYLPPHARQLYEQFKERRLPDE